MCACVCVCVCMYVCVCVCVCVCERERENQPASEGGSERDRLPSLSPRPPVCPSVCLSVYCPSPSDRFMRERGVHNFINDTPSEGCSLSVVWAGCWQGPLFCKAPSIGRFCFYVPAARSVRLIDGSAQTIARTTTLRLKLQIKLAVSASHSIMTPVQPVLALIPSLQAADIIAAAVPIFSDLNIGTPVAILPGAGRYRFSARTGRPGVIL